jgi:hypothetical protein
MLKENSSYAIIIQAQKEIFYTAIKIKSDYLGVPV